MSRSPLKTPLEDINNFFCSAKWGLKPSGARSWGITTEVTVIMKCKFFPLTFVRGSHASQGCKSKRASPASGMASPSSLYRSEMLCMANARKCPRLTISAFSSALQNQTWVVG